ncbi:MAG: hypothetical protein IJ244_04475 [Bacteroidaceae bacterium]|nr:hypothetical protein [Bacteroidaceae bacterium]
MKRFLKFFLSLLAALLVAGLVWSMAFFQITVTNGSQEPPLIEGDRVVVSRLGYGIRLPFGKEWSFVRGLPELEQMLAFHDPLMQKGSSASIYVGTCQALPGDTVLLSSADGERHPFVVPHKGEPVAVLPWNALLLAHALHLHEGHNVCWQCDSLLLVDGQRCKEVTFSSDYLWVRSASPEAYDSRKFGLLPVSCVMGRLLFVSWSKESASPLFSGFRTDRFFLPVSSISSSL